LVGLVVGAVVLIKRYVFDGDLLAIKPKTGCTKCGQALNSDWACCPKCGETRSVPVQPLVANPQTA